MATLRHHWKFDENTGQYAYDSAGTNNLKLYDTISGDRHVAWDSGGYNGACLKGDGANTGTANNIGALSSADGTALPTNISITAWFNTSSASKKAFISFAPDSDPSQWNILVYISNSVGDGGTVYKPAVSYMWTGGTYDILCQPASPAPAASNDGQWHFIAFTTSSTGPISKFYLDDCTTPVATAAHQPGGGGQPTSNWSWRIGGGRWVISTTLTNGTIDGLVDDVRIYDGALTPEEICAIKKDFEVAVKNPIMFSCNT
jgi:hypothetical protein